MKIAVIGAGAWGRNIIKTLYQMNALDSVTEANDSLRQSIVDQYPGVIVYSTIEAMLAKTNNPIVLATPVVTHFSLGKILLEQGRDLLIEKPMAMNEQECITLNALAQQNNCVLMVGHLLIYQPAIQFLKAYLDDKKLGKLYTFNQVRCNLGTVRVHENALYSLGVHDFAVLDYLIGENPESITSVGQAILNPKVEDDVTVHLKYPNGLQAHLHTSWLWPSKERYMIISGEKGMLKFDELSQTITLFAYDYNATTGLQKSEPDVIFNNQASPLNNELQHFIDCCENKIQPISDGTQGQRVVAMIEDAIKQL